MNSLGFYFLLYDICNHAISFKKLKKNKLYFPTIS